MIDFKWMTQHFFPDSARLHLRDGLTMHQGELELHCGCGCGGITCSRSYVFVWRHRLFLVPLKGRNNRIFVIPMDEQGTWETPARN
jgi:hypothetical protein